jgi:hypothetical protein
LAIENQVHKRDADHRISLLVEDVSQAGKTKQGYLYKKSKNAIKGWLIRWVVVSDNRLYWYKKWKVYEFIFIIQNENFYFVLFFLN